MEDITPDQIVLPPHWGKKRVANFDKEDYIIRKAKWASMKEEFLELTITGAGVHWPTLAAKYGFSAQQARNKASNQKWYAEIEDRRKAREDVLEQKLTERTSMALDELNRDFATNEAAIRKRHAVMARGLQGRAISRLKEIPLSEFSPRDALAMLKLGIDEERFALGMKQVFEGTVTPSIDPAFKPLVEQIGGHAKVQKIGMLLLEALKNTPTDSNEENLLDSGLGGITDAPLEIEEEEPVYKPLVASDQPVVFGVGASAINSTKPKKAT